MKYLILFCTIILSFEFNYAQKHDYNWAMSFGYSDTIIDPNQGNRVFLMKFGQSELKFDTVFDSYNEEIKKFIHFNQDGTSTFSNSEGVFKYATDGKRIYNAIWDVMKNGDSLNFGPKWNSYFYSHPVPYGIIPIPDPANKNKFSYVLHTTLIKPGLSHIPKYTKIDLNGDNGLGLVVEKNISIFNNIDSLENILAIQHANGRDWWILCHKFKSIKYYKKLLTPEGFMDKGFQELGIEESPNNFFITTCVMSPKGDKYCRYSPIGKFQICDFDRCTGDLSNPEIIEVPDSLINNGRMCFSNSSQFLYSTGQSDLTKNTYLCQIDITTKPVIFNIISKYPNENYLECNSFYQLEKGPDNKIYVGSFGGSKCLGIIENPDMVFPSCDFVLNKEFLPFNSGHEGGFPHFTNYRLGPLIGSGCDTITSTLDINDHNPIAITYPNPVSESITIELMKSLQHSRNLEVSLIDISGKLLYSGKIPPYAYIHQIDVRDLVPGMYCVLIRDKFKLLGTVKVLKK